MDAIYNEITKFIISHTMDNNTSLYRINYMLKSCLISLRCGYTVDETNNSYLNNSDNNQDLSIEGKKNQLFEQMISQVRVHFRTRVREKELLTIDGDMLSDLSEP
jgi:hypothetical protein